MHLLALAALLDPATPAQLLGAIGRTHDPRTVAHLLLAHPNTPTPPAGALIANTDELTQALDSPALTATTRQRVLDATPTPVLLRAFTRTPSPHPDMTRALADRVDGPPENQLVAVEVFDHADLSDDQRLAALRVVLHCTTGVQAPDKRIYLEAARHPQHLSELADVARTASASGTLMRLRGRLEAGADPYADLVHEARARLAHSTVFQADRRRIEERVANELATTPDVHLAEELATQYPTFGQVADAIVAAPALAGTDVWYRAWQGRSYMGSPTPPEASSRNPALIDATYSHDPFLVADTSDQPLGADPAVLAASFDAIDRFPSPDRSGPAAVHAARIVMHPATPAAVRRAAIRFLKDRNVAMYDPQDDTSSTGADYLLVYLARTHADDLSTELGHLPVPLLADLDPTGPGAASLAHHIAGTLRTLPADAAAAAISLEPTFTATLGELLTTARALRS